MLTGRGSAAGTLRAEEAAALCEEYVAREGLARRQVLAIIPDHTRSAPIGLFFRTLYRLFGAGPGRIDFLIALGTHPPMSDEAIERRLEFAPG